MMELIGCKVHNKMMSYNLEQENHTAHIFHIPGTL